ncbi:MAG TPA: hypothetical protein VG167_14925 [Verrucomicrobiae bacterium]|nr:hypothetical protein [Verrucomicrobiae bacterium]
MMTPKERRPSLDLGRRLRTLREQCEAHWWCRDCERITEREESDQGQPAKCSLCGSHRIEYHHGI